MSLVLFSSLIASFSALQSLFMKVIFYDLCHFTKIGKKLANSLKAYWGTDGKIKIT